MLLYHFPNPAWAVESLKEVIVLLVLQLLPVKVTLHEVPQPSDRGFCGLGNVTNEFIDLEHQIDFGLRGELSTAMCTKSSNDSTSLLEMNSLRMCDSVFDEIVAEDWLHVIGVILEERVYVGVAVEVAPVEVAVVEMAPVEPSAVEMTSEVVAAIVVAVVVVGVVVATGVAVAALVVTATRVESMIKKAVVVIKCTTNSMAS